MLLCCLDGIARTSRCTFHSFVAVASIPLTNAPLPAGHCRPGLQHRGPISQSTGHPRAPAPDQLRRVQPSGQQRPGITTCQRSSQRRGAPGARHQIDAGPLEARSARSEPGRHPLRPQGAAGLLPQHLIVSHCVAMPSAGRVVTTIGSERRSQRRAAGGVG